MLGAEADGARQFGLPCRERLTGPGVNQIEADAAERRLRLVQRRQPLVHVMRAPQKGQRLVVERLQAKRHAIDTRRSDCGEARRLHR